VVSLASEGIIVAGSSVEGAEELLTPGALRFIADLHRCFEARRLELLGRRRAFQAMLDDGGRPRRRRETRGIREGAWSAPRPPSGFPAWRVEAVGATDREALLDGLYSSADVFIADFDESTSPTWDNILSGHRHLRDVVGGAMAYRAPDGRHTELAPVAATLVLQPRPWDVVEPRVRVDHEPVSASLFDVGLFLFHNAAHLHSIQSGPFLSLTKLESHLEARLWNELLLYLQPVLGLPAGAIRVSVTVDTLGGAFEAEEIVYELQEHAGGLAFDRWSYLFSLVRALRRRRDFVLPDVGLLTMERHCLATVAESLVDIGRRRKVQVIGMPSMQMPIPSDPIADRVALARAVADKEREAAFGFDGSRVRHPDFVRLTRGVFEGARARPGRARVSRASPRPRDLLTTPDGPVTEDGLRHSVRLVLRYLEAWLRGEGCVPIRHILATQAVADTCRAQLWQWVHHGVHLDDGRQVTEVLYSRTVDYEMGSVRRALGEDVWAMGEFERARALLDALVLAPDLAPSLAVTGLGALVERELSMR
jgi:malate synthase